MAQFSGALSSYSRYNSGHGNFWTWLEFPATDEEINKALQKIGNPEETFFSDWDYSAGMILDLGEGTSTQEANEIADFIENLDDSEQDIFSAILEHRDYDEAVKIFNDQDYQFYDDCNSETDLGYAVAENFSIPDHLENYIDYEAIGRDYDQNANGGFTANGYIEIF